MGDYVHRRCQLHPQSFLCGRSPAPASVCSEGSWALGGAEFRLPVLVGYFRYRLLRAISLNMAVSLLTVLAAATTRVLLAGQGPDLALAPVALAMMIGGMAGEALAAR